jgi:archaellum component FlaF (FlaF/FlaG flagellin family)
MTFKTVTCAIVMSSAFLFGGAAYADTMVGSASVTDADLPAVQARCDELASAEATTSLSGSAEDSTADDSTADATLDGAEQVDGAAAATTASIDLGTVTLDQCKAAGLTK